jgi:hypothetical protein
MSPRSRKLRDKFEWPEVVGKEASAAEEVIRKENEELYTETIEPGIAIPPDFQVKRVRILLDE